VKNTLIGRHSVAPSITKFLFSVLSVISISHQSVNSVLRATIEINSLYTSRFGVIFGHVSSRFRNFHQQYEMDGQLNH